MRTAKYLISAFLSAFLVSVPVSAYGQATGGRSGQDIPLGGFQVPNPWPDVTNIFGLADKLTSILINFAIPIAVILVIYAGVMFLTSAGNTGRIGQAKNILWYTVLGFSVLLIGKGFFLLIESILNLGK